MSRSRRGRAPLLLLAALAIPPAAAAPRPACAAAPGHAAVALRFSTDDERRSCVALGAEEISGLEALQATGLPVVTRDFGPMGEFVCSIGDVGPPAAECPARDGSYWAYFRLQDGAWVGSPRGASLTRVGCGGVEGWAWRPQGRGPAPSPASFDAVCPSAACGPEAPSPAVTPTQPAAASPPAEGPATAPPAAEPRAPPDGGAAAAPGSPEAPAGSPAPSPSAGGPEAPSPGPERTVATVRSPAAADPPVGGPGAAPYLVLALAIVALAVLRARAARSGRPR